MIEIVFKEKSGIVREDEPVTFGIPFPAGKLKDTAKPKFSDEDGKILPSAANVMARWHDNSIKWLLVDLQVTVPAMGTRVVKLSDEPGVKEKKLPSKLELRKSSDNKIIVSTGVAEFYLNTGFLIPFSRIDHAGSTLVSESSSGIILTDAEGKEWEPEIFSWSVEHDSSLRKSLLFEGCFQNNNKSHPLHYKSWIHFFAGKSFVKIDFMLKSPEAALHSGGVWDLGDKGSQYFRDLSFCFSVDEPDSSNSYYIAEYGSDSESNNPGNIVIYQDSSGGKNWRSKNHVNRKGKTPLSFKGYKVYKNNTPVAEGLNAVPFMGAGSSSGAICGFVKNFRQNFPKAMELAGGNLKIRLFPEYFNDLFELQGGEQKTHTFYIGAEKKGEHAKSLKWAYEPLCPEISSHWYYRSRACPKPVPLSEVSEHKECRAYQKIVDYAVSGENSYFAKRKIIDEFGWRNFGDVYADHEAVFSDNKQEFISHYNNQYDVIKGALIQFMRTGEKAWFILALEMGDHVSDIDIYHTEKDKYQFNKGLFWHTNHHLDAATATHRTHSKHHRKFKPAEMVGGGPAYDHNYASGLLYLYWMTGETRYKDAVVELSENIIEGLKGPDTLCESALKSAKIFFNIFKKIAGARNKGFEDVYIFNGPGRASGNSLNTLLDAWLLTSDKSYLKWAEDLITRCVSPDDDQDKMDMLNAELRWMYTIFLLALGRYLDIKKSMYAFDDFFIYARKTLLNYVEWMAEKEYPYLEKPDILEFPNETWAAQDIRKSDIFAITAFYAPEPLKKRFAEKSRYFFESSVNSLGKFETWTFTRPLAIMMTNGMPYMEMQSNKDSLSEFTEDDLTVLSAEKLRSGAGFYCLADRIKRFTLKKEIDWIRRRFRTSRKELVRPHEWNGGIVE